MFIIMYVYSDVVMISGTSDNAGLCPADTGLSSSDCGTLDRSMIFITCIYIGTHTCAESACSEAYAAILLKS